MNILSNQSQKADSAFSESPHLLAAKAELLQFRQKQTEYFLKAASKILQLREGLSKSDCKKIASWLKREVGFSGAEVKSYYQCDETLIAQEDVILASRLSPDVIRALAGCDEEARTECLVKAHRGDHIDARQVGAIKRAHRVAAMSAEETSRRLRDLLFADAARGVGARTKARLEKDAADLAAMLPYENERIVDRFEVFRDERELSGSEELRSTVTERARILREDVEAMFPDVREDPASLSASSVAGASLVEAWKIIAKLEKGVVQVRSKFDRRDTQTFLEFVAGIKSSALSGAKEASIAPRIEVHPTFVDIDAGLGGTALGLEAAGFEPVAVFAGKYTGIGTIRSNRRSWRPKDLSELESEYEALRGKEVDLVTSGLPWHHHKAFRKESCARAQRAVEALRPKYFMFETLAEDNGDVDLKERFGTGYDVTWYSLDIRSYGIAQAKPRVVMIGTRKGLRRDLSIPVIQPSRPCSLAQAMGGLVDDYISKATADLGVTGDAASRRHQDEIARWRKVWEQKCAPPLPVPGKNSKKQAWKELGVDIAGYASHPPSLEELGTGFKLTSDMLKRLQGFPVQWHVTGPPESKPKLLASALPPIVAKMLGLAIHSAVAGVDFDYQRAAAARLLPLKRTHRVAGDIGEVLEYRTPAVSPFIVGPHLAYKDRESRAALDRVRDRRRSMQKASPALAE